MMLIKEEHALESFRELANHESQPRVWQAGEHPLTIPFHQPFISTLSTNLLHLLRPVHASSDILTCSGRCHGTYFPIIVP
jgi:hypothetical protein